MKVFLHGIALCAYVVDANSGLQSYPAPQLSIWTKSGTVHGTVSPTTPDVREFLGIPYAVPPVGLLRFTPPTPAKPFGDFEAKTPGANCVQYLGIKPGIYHTENTHFNTPGPYNEDCLTLSIWAPGSRHGKRPENLPVLLWIYGGGWQTGGKNIPYLVPSQWVQRSRSHIVVAINYRLNVFGFPNAAGLGSQPQNLGLLDQRLAAEWVRDNIEYFGGDPARITFFGQSVGAISVGYHAYAWPKDPIASGLIMQSGNEFLGTTSPYGEYSNFTFLASHLGCAGLTPAAELACMRKVDANAIEDFIHEYDSAGTKPAILFQPIADGKTVFTNYRELLYASKVAKLPIIMGSNTEEAVPYVPYNPAGVDMDLVHQLTFASAFCPVWKAAVDRLKNGLPVYRYLYAGNFTNISPKGWMGAYHAAEQPLIFGTHADFNGNSTELEWRTSWAMQNAWLSFAESRGKSLPKDDNWPVYSSVEGGQVRLFGSDVAAQTVSMQATEERCSAVL